MEDTIAAFIEVIEAAAKQKAVPITLDVDERGARTRISITIEPAGEPGIVKERRYP